MDYGRPLCTIGREVRSRCRDYPRRTRGGTSSCKFDYPGLQGCLCSGQRNRVSKLQASLRGQHSHVFSEKQGPCSTLMRTSLSYWTSMALRRLQCSKHSGVTSRRDVCEQRQEKRSPLYAYLLEGVTRITPLSVYATLSGNSSLTTLQSLTTIESKSVIWRNCFLIL